MDLGDEKNSKFKILLPSLIKNNSIKKINLQENYMKESDIGELIEKNSSITELNLSSN
jgi:hypothetical protein